MNPPLPLCPPHMRAFHPGPLPVDGARRRKRQPAHREKTRHLMPPFSETADQWEFPPPHLAQPAALAMTFSKS